MQNETTQLNQIENLFRQTSSDNPGKRTGTLTQNLPTTHHEISSKTGITAQPHISFPENEIKTAMQKHQQGDLAQAMAEYERLLQREPDHADALHLSGVILHQQGDHRAAIKRIERALQLKPNALLFLKNLASACRSAGDLEKAKRLCEEVLASEPNDSVVLNMLGRIHEQQNDYAAAVHCYRTALNSNPTPDDKFDILIHAGDCYSRLNDREQSLQCFRYALSDHPKSLVANHNLARELQFANRMSEAEAYYMKALEIDRACSSAWNNLGVIYQGRAEYLKGLNSLNQAIEANPNLPDAHNNLANILEAIGEPDRCQELYERAIQLRPDYAEAHHSLSQVHLRNREFETGWKLYNWRYRKQDHDHRPFRHPTWNGESLTNKNLLVFSEQGIGDVVMFATCLPDLLAQAGQVTLEVDGRMVSLFERSFPGTKVIPREDLDPIIPVTLPGIDFQICLADLPGRYRNHFSQFPRQEKILTADAELRQKWKARFDELGEGLKIGISWFGGKNLDLQTRRSLPLGHWEQILKTPDVHFVNLQYGDHQQELLEIHHRTGVKINDWSDSDPMKDLDDFSAKIAELDLVISIDNATVHFAGGLGTPTWCLLNSLPDWRWFKGETSTPWYNSLKLFRQLSPGDWSTVVDQVAEQLITLVKYSSHKMPQRELISQKSPPQVIEKSSKEKALRPQCAIITPVGPGHAEIYKEAERSIRDACVRSPGPFRKVIPFRIDDQQGKIGRSRARNFAVEQAAAQGIEWVFFLDADDVLVPDTFANVEPLLDDYDAIWGQIFSFQDGSKQAERREGQLGPTNRFEDVLNADPFHSLQMGHFVRTEIAAANPFDESLDVGEDFHYYMRIWAKHRCIKINEPLFANRRGRHSIGPRSGTGHEWTVRVNQMLNQYRNQPATSPAQQVVAPMKLAIYGMMRSGTTLLCDKLTVPDHGLILLEPNIHLNNWPDQVLKQMQKFGLDVSEEAWKKADESPESFQSYFNRRLLSKLQSLDYWGVKMVNFANWQSFLEMYPPEHLILCVRDLRDVILSALDLAPKLDLFVDDNWIEKRAIQTAKSLVEMAKRPHTLVRYDDMCQQPELIDKLAEQLGLPGLGNHRMSLEAVPHRKYEDDKHAGTVTTNSVNRYLREPNGPAKELAERVFRICKEYNEAFGYTEDNSATSVTSFAVPGVIEEKTLISNAAQLDEFWKNDQLANIIPQNADLGAFPEGWDVRPVLWEQLKEHIKRSVLEIGCGYGRLCQAFPTDYYLGLDVNPQAIQTAEQTHPGYEFQTIGFCDEYPKTDAALLYTVLLHIDDETITPMLERICRSSDVILIAEILGKERWRRTGNPPVFNRDFQDYIQLMMQQGYYLSSCIEKPYEHYPETNISFLKFQRMPGK